MKFVIDCKNMPLYSAGISEFFKPVLKEIVANRRDSYFYLVAPCEFDCTFLNGLSNWEIKIIERPNFFSATFSLLLYDILIFPIGISKFKDAYLLSPYYDFVVPKCFSKKSIITVHDLCYWDCAHLYKRRVRWYHQILLMLNIRRAARIVTVSKTSLSRIQSVFGKPVSSRTRIVYNTFTPQSTVVSGIPGGDSSVTAKILYTGGFEARKNVSRLFAAVKRVSSVRSVRLYFTGPADDNLELRRLVDRFRLNDIVVFTGLESREALEQHYRSCDLVVNPSLYEGFGRSNLEAASYNKPLVCSDIEVFRELVGDGAVYCDPFSVESISNALLIALDLKKVHYHINFEKFSVDENGRRLNQVVEEVINGSE